MNILYISNEYPPETGNGGIGTYTCAIAEVLTRLGHSISVIAGSSDGTEHTVQQNGVTVYRVPPVPFPLPSTPKAYPLRQLATILFPHILHRLCRCIAVKHKVDYLTKRITFDIIEAAECGAESLLVSKKASRARVIRLHTPWEFIRKLDCIGEPPGDRFFLPFIERIVAKRATAVTSPSQCLARTISKQWSLENVTVIPNPLPLKDFPQTSGGGWIFTGRIERRKGVHHLINAYRRLCQQKTNIPDLTLIGRAYGKDKNGNTYGAYISRLIAHQSLQGKIQWIDHSPPEVIIEHLARSSVAFFPSLWENFPYTCLEAMACGCAVVTSDAGGFPEILKNGTHGILVNLNSSQALYNAMHHLACDPDYANTLGKNARKHIHILAGNESVSRQMEFFYHSLIEAQQ